MQLFQKAEKLTKRVTDLESRISGLWDERNELEDENAKLSRKLRETTHKKRLEEENIKHLVRIKQEKSEIEFLKKGAKLEADKATEIGKIKDNYRDKIEGALEKRSTELREMYSEILARLPDVNVMLGREAESTGKE